VLGKQRKRRDFHWNSFGGLPSFRDPLSANHKKTKLAVGKKGVRKKSQTIKVKTWENSGEGRKLQTEKRKAEECHSNGEEWDVREKGVGLIEGCWGDGAPDRAKSRDSQRPDQRKEKGLHEWHF